MAFVIHQPQRGCACVLGAFHINLAQPRWGWGLTLQRQPRVGEAPTLGFETQSWQDCLEVRTERTERDKTFYESKCASLDRQIDNLVYELYDLTPEEIEIVEGQRN
jgi:hypothetical protein